jgi:hypothetical protein
MKPMATMPRQALRKNPDWTIAGTHDFNRDGIADILWRSTDTARSSLVYEERWDKARLQTTQNRLDWTVAGSDDFNGDQIPDILWRNAVTGQVNLWLMKADGDHAGDKPLRENPDWTIAGTHDFNRDGIADILWRSTDTGQVVLWFMKNDGTRLGTNDSEPIWTWQSSVNIRFTASSFPTK